MKIIKKKIDDWKPASYNPRKDLKLGDIVLWLGKMNKKLKLVILR